MPLDAVCLQAVVHELAPQLIGLRIDKVQQPAKNQVVLLLRGSHRLLLSCGADSARLQLTDTLRDNPAEPPMFCMLLRKHLVGARIVAVTQPHLERLVTIELAITDAFGQPGQRKLVLETMGRRSNLILLDGEGRIIDCLRRVDAEMSMQRQVLPGLFYQLPARGEKVGITDVTEEEFFDTLRGANPEQQLDKWLLNHFFGISPLIARELVFRVTGETDRHIFELSQEDDHRFWVEIANFQSKVTENQFTPYCLKKKEKYMDFSYLPIGQYGDAVTACSYPDFSALMDDFFVTRERQERIRQRGQDLIRTATTARDRMKRKMALQEKDYQNTQNRDRLRICGDLITANLYRMDRGASKLVTENFYDETGGEITITLDPLLTPQQNAAKYYKKYTKAKTAEKYLRDQMAISRRDFAYLESVLQEIDEAETEQDFLDIREELKDAGFLRKHGKDKKRVKRQSKPREFRTTSGFRVLVGRNNRQNDKLTLKEADYRDIWLHTQKIHGSHVILCTEGREPDIDTIVEAAKIAAWYSQAKNSGNVPVDYTLVKKVKKPAGARPGMVIYPTYQTVNVVPNEEFIRTLRLK